MTIGFPAYFEEVRSFQCSTDVLLPAIEHTLQLLSWRYARSDDYLFEVTIPVNLRHIGFFHNPGERVFIDLRGETTVRVRSQFSDFIFFCDLGWTNRSNVNRFFEQLELLVK